MQRFSELIEQLERTKSTKEKIQYIRRYFEKTDPQDAAWGLFFLSGHKLKRLIGPSKLFEWCLEVVPLPEWLVLESYSAVGDLAETIALLMAKKTVQPIMDTLSLSQWINEQILPLGEEDKEIQKKQIIQFWHGLNPRSIFILNKILTGSLRIGVSELITIKALSLALNVPKEIISQRLMGNWQPSAEFFKSLKNPENEAEIANLNPYPFYLASPLQPPLEKLGHPLEWFAEWKWDGIRAQGVNRKGQIALWSRGNELISSQFPEIGEVLKKLPSGTVLDGEILPFKDGMPLPFGELQKRLGRKNVTSAMINSIPIIFMIYDILEFEHRDLRKLPLLERRALLENFLEIDGRLKISPKIEISEWDEMITKRETASSNNTEGLIIKKKNSPYLIGRRKGNWWKYKIDPKTIDAVLIYAQPGHGWRANLYTDYTFGVWQNQDLVPITKAYSGLSMDEIYELDKWIRKNTVDKFGPVRKVIAEQVFEIAFEGVQISLRHKSGVAFRFPRIAKWRKDKPIAECDTLEGVKTEFLPNSL